MKLATFNINNVNRRLPNLLRWLKEAKPDVVCLQELKCTDETFPAEALAKAGYRSLWRGQRTWNGVAILSRGSEPVVTRTALPGDPDDDQARYLEAAVEGLIVGCIYLPNGNPQPGPKFDYKLAWFRRLNAHARKLLAENVPVALAGDFNVAPTEIDIYPTTSWDDDALVQPHPRAAYARLIAQGWTDALRETYGEERVYTFWHYLRRRWERDAGLRLDHILLSPDLAPGYRSHKPCTTASSYVAFLKPPLTKGLFAFLPGPSSRHRHGKTGTPDRASRRAASATPPPVETVGNASLGSSLDEIS